MTLWLLSADGPVARRVFSNSLFKAVIEIALTQYGALRHLALYACSKLTAQLTLMISLQLVVTESPNAYDRKAVNVHCSHSWVIPAWSIMSRLHQQLSLSLALLMIAYLLLSWSGFHI